MYRESDEKGHEAMSSGVLKQNHGGIRGYVRRILSHNRSHLIVFALALLLFSLIAALIAFFGQVMQISRNFSQASISIPQPLEAVTQKESFQLSDGSVQVTTEASFTPPATNGNTNATIQKEEYQSADGASGGTSLHIESTSDGDGATVQSSSSQEVEIDINSNSSTVFSASTSQSTTVSEGDE